MACYITYSKLSCKLKHFRHKMWTKPSKSCAFETISCCTVPALPAPQPLLQLPRPVDLVDLGDWEDYGVQSSIDQDAPESPPCTHDINIQLYDLFKGLPSFKAYSDCPHTVTVHIQ